LVVTLTTRTAAVFGGTVDLGTGAKDDAAILHTEDGRILQATGEESPAPAMTGRDFRAHHHGVDNVIEVRGLHKSYGSVVAVDGVSFDVRGGEIFGILGPNGAGKTTTVESIAGLRRPDAGTISILGLDPQRDGRRLRQRVGVQLQQAVLPDRLKVGEALQLFASFYESPADWRRLLEQWDLTEKRYATFAGLSGGQRQRLFIALALVGAPEVVILDELTSGLDPQARRATWRLIRDVRDAGTTVVLVTHFMDEAERLCDRLAVIDEGHVVAHGSPRDLIGALAVQARVRFTANGSDLGFLAEVAGVTQVTIDAGEVVIEGRGPILAGVAGALADHRIHPPDLRTEQPNLEDVFLDVTGKRLRD
jgi:ABC-2 type transport system ATP-binding protein